MHLKLQRNFLLSIMITGLLFVGGQSFTYAQDGSGLSNVIDTEQPPPSEQHNKKIEVTGPQAPGDEENHDTKDLEQLLKRYNTDSKKVLEDTSKIHTIQDAATSEVNEKDIEEMRPSEDPTKNATVNAVKKVKEDLSNKRKENISSDFSHSVRLALEPLQKLSEKELLKRLDDSTKESAARPYMDKFPEIIIFAVKLIKDKESIPSLAKILENHDRLIRFTGVMIATIIFGFILKRVMHREGRSFIKAVFYFFLRMYIMFAIRVGVVYYFFSTELTPAAKIFKQTFM